MKPEAEPAAESGVRTLQITNTDLFYLLWGAERWCQEHNSPQDRFHDPILEAVRRNRSSED